MSATPKKVLVRCDGAPEIGFGHVVRCLALADELRDRHGCQVDFAIQQGPQGVEQICTQGYQVHQSLASVDNLDEGEWLQQVVSDTEARVLVLDVRTDLATSAVQIIRESGVLIVSIDDPSERRLLADLAFYPPVPQVERLDWTGFTGQRFVGWDWVLLRPQFAEAARHVHARTVGSMTISTSADRQLTLLVTMGGSDPAGLTLMALEAIEQLTGNFRVLVVTGCGFIHEDELANWLAKTKRNYDLRRDSHNMASLMMEADIAIVSFGVTAYELAVVGVPAIYLCLTHEHAESGIAFTSAKMAISLGEHQGCNPKKLSNVINSLLTNSKLRHAVKERSTRLLDGQGVERIAAKILDINA